VWALAALAEARRVMSFMVMDVWLVDLVERCRSLLRLTIVRKVVTEEEEQSLSLYSRVTTVFVRYRWLDTVVLHPGAITDQPPARPSHNESNL
jgi:hypothetical protein